MGSACREHDSGISTNNSYRSVSELDQYEKLYSSEIVVCTIYVTVKGQMSSDEVTEKS